MMSILEELMQHSQFTMIVISAVLLVVGLPRTRGRYRVLVASFSILSIGAALQWYATYIVGLHYLRSQTHWPYLMASALFVLAAAVFASEFIALRWFKRVAKQEEKAKQSP